MAANGSNGYEVSGDEGLLGAALVADEVGHSLRQGDAASAQRLAENYDEMARDRAAKHEWLRVELQAKREEDNAWRAALLRELTRIADALEQRQP